MSRKEKVIKLKPKKDPKDKKEKKDPTRVDRTNATIRSPCPGLDLTLLRLQDVTDAVHDCDRQRWSDYFY